LAAYTVLGETAAALEVAKQAISIAPDDKELVEQSAIAAIEARDYGLAELLLPKLPESSNATLVRFQLYTHTSDWPKLIEIAKKPEHVSERERPPVITLGRLATLMIGARSKEDQHNELKDILTTTPHDLRAYVLVADFALRLGVQDISDEAYSRAVATAAEDTIVIGRHMLARSAGQREDWRAVIQLLDNNIDTDIDSEELNLLATAFVNETPTRKRAVAVFSEIDPSVRNLPFYLTAHGLLQSKRGDLSAAEKSFERVLAADPENLTALRNLFVVYLRQERSDRNSLIKSRIENSTLKH
jgi:tetratricopeptide (TPR) repeat protein